jgi:streptogramin lyase
VLASATILRAYAVAIGAGEVWVLVAPRSSSPDPTLSHAIKRTAALWELDPGDNRVVGTPLRLGAAGPTAITVTANDVWVADEGQAVIRIPLSRCRATRCG